MSSKRASVVAALLDDELCIELVDKGIALARAGDRAILKLLLTRVFADDRRLHIDLPKLGCTSDASAAVAAIVADVAAGRITPNDGVALAHTVETCARLISLDDLVARVDAIEKRLKAS